MKAVVNTMITSFRFSPCIMIITCISRLIKVINHDNCRYPLKAVE
jgi:hypothetical protein